LFQLSVSQCKLCFFFWSKIIVDDIMDIGICSVLKANGCGID
jgi:hypothetical protein